uniref:Putative DNAJ heat shock N-terminal domain-containing protein n=1 Tax=Davidia involucrata TaxID=16924 RepID=A0A5B7BN85_DAVIN
MHYNKTEAIREKEIAEKMILSNDYVSARDKLLKAQQLFPTLDHIGPMVTVCDILSAASNKVPGYDIDYYWVLQLMPSSALSDVRCRYQNLVSLLQPIKNKFPGTELALKLILEAFSVLSDRDKRFAFDLKRGTSWKSYGSFDVEASFFPSMSGKETVIAAQISSGCDRVSSIQTLDGEHGGSVSTDMLSERAKDLGPKLLAKYNTNEQHHDTSLGKPSSFSSDFSSQKNMGAYRDTAMDNINSPKEVYHTSLKGNLSWYSIAVAQKRLDRDYYDFENDRKAESFEAGQIWAADYQSDEPQNCRYARINSKLRSEGSVTWLKPVPVSKGERRWCDAGLPVACGSFSVDPEMSEKVIRPTIFSYKCSWFPGITEEQIEIYPKKGEVWALYEDWNLDEWAYNPETIKRCKFKLVEILSDFSKYLGADSACLVKVDGFRSVFQRQTKEGYPVIFHISPSILYMLSHNVPAYRFTGGEIDGVVSGMFELDQLALRDNTSIQDMDSQMTTKEGKSDSSNFTSPAKLLPSLKSYSESKILGPNWLPNNFATGQVWAVYCGKDLMPRQYVRVNNVISGSQVCVTFLEPEPIFDHEINWKKENLPIVCGIYRAAGTNVNLNISQFSHLVKCLQCTTRSIYKIYPMKGEIWAMYKNWTGKWKHSDYANYECCIVETLSDFSEDGMMIARLGEVKGCLTFFHRQQHNGFDLTRAVSKTEMLSFSHRIPAFRVPGIGRYGIPESSWHLEPDALPPKHGNSS